MNLPGGGDLQENLPNSERVIFLRRFSLFLIFYAFIIILWGAYVRISGSGDGCGVHWPLCNGELIPYGAMIQTWIEFFHRMKSGVFGFAVLALWLMSLKAFPKGHLARTLSTFIFAFTVLEALIGAALVLYGWVDQDPSTARVWMHSFHFGNTLLLLASMSFYFVTTYFQDPQWVMEKPQLKLVAIAGVLFFAIGVTGSWGSLTSMLFPVSSLGEAIHLDFSPDSPWYAQYRFLHPILAMTQTIVLLFVIRDLKHLPPNRWAWLGKSLTLLVLTQVAFGMLTLLFLSPVWMKLTHLLLADLVWVNFLLFIGWSFTRDYVEKPELLKLQDSEILVSRFRLTRAGNA